MQAYEAPVNYIQHLTGFFEKSAEDARLTAFHQALYLALFMTWNSSKFKNPISIARDEIMNLSKIGSKNTYIKCLKELTLWGYIQYRPTRNHFVGSKVMMYRFDTSSGIDTLSCPENGTLPSTTTIPTFGTPRVPYSGTQVGHYLNNRNNKQINIREKENSSNEFPPTQKNKKMENQKMAVPDIQEVKNYFLEKQNPTTEAERFFNYFQSNGWLVGGKTKMKDWKAAARNWMIRSKEFQKEKQPANPLSTNQNKDYSIPL
ncbi:MAG: hypothetical protein BGO87_07360 [Flavobacteriia bacterium 40-80]|uniref:transcriptional regulator n=1 Tax=uncultured Flavobacterium sp. TaxID=165435 RepID=UPI00095FC267|nr:transcriptional regulator [uncultured Flavobacterium sp.]OJX36265.1 MAG: hypothetical protein BGO87_07360 [Flavobacteriia bacterium 40-80]